MTTKKLLEKRGYHIETASSGMEALKKLKKLHIELVILDVKMPNMDGISTLRRIKHDFPLIEIIMLTGQATIETAVEGVRLGAANYLRKPVDIDDIAERIEETITKRKSINEQNIRRMENFEKVRNQLFISISGILLLPYGLLVLIGYSWFNHVCKILIVTRGQTVFYGWLCRNNHALTILLVMIIFFLILISTWFAVKNLIHRVRIIAEKRDELQFQLFHASKLASIGELATGVAHEINNPLAIIVARCGIIQDLLNPEFNIEQNPQKFLEELLIITDAAFRARNITEQLINFGLKSEPRLGPCNVNQILDEILDELKEHDFKNEEIKIVRRFQPDLPVVRLDATQIKQVFLNLLNNADDAISGAGTITISTEKKNDHIDITVEDNGSGMSLNQKRQIFRPFYTTKEVGKGTGLSLSVSLSIVESLGGTIDVQSLEGVGSSFSISLPIYG